MRALFLICAALTGLSFSALAQDALTPADIVTLESTGTMRDLSAGAFEKTIWRGDKRSDITQALKALPPESQLRTLHDLKRRVLLSATDASLIENDIQPTNTDNLFILRIQKLQEMGLYEEALKLYTDNIDTPRDARLAEVGLTLMTQQRGLATACLEEKVLAPDFEGDAFFTLMDAICSFELGQTDTPPKIAQSRIIEAALADETIKFPATDRVTWAALSPLELAILKSEGHIDYAGFNTAPAALRPYPARVLMTFMDDKRLPQETLLAPLQVELARRGYVSVKKLPATKDAKILSVDVVDKRKTNPKLAEDILWKGMLPLLQTETEVVKLTPYGALLKDADPARVPAAELTKSIGVILASGYELPAAWCQRLAADKSDQARVYYQVLTFLKDCEAPADNSVDNLETALGAFPVEKNKNLWTIIYLLAPDEPAYANIKAIYDKQFPLTPEDDYVMHEQAKTSEGAENKAFQGFGVKLLRILVATKGETGENINPPVLQIAIKSLLNEGLENDARQLAREVFVGILLNYKNDGEN